MTVSVIIPTYNCGRLIEEALESVWAQTYVPVEVIIVDDGSTDDTVERLQRYGSRIKLLRQTNAGPSIARNRGARMACGDILAFLDADDLWLPRKLELQVKHLTEGEFGLVNCGVAIVGPHDELLRTIVQSAEGFISEQMLSLHGVLSFTCGTVVYRHVFNDVGGFDEGLRAYEDWDFTFKVSLRYQIGFVPEVLYIYRRLDAKAYDAASCYCDIILPLVSRAIQLGGTAFRHKRRLALGAAHMNIARMFYSERQLLNSARHMIESILLHPPNCLSPLRYAFKRVMGLPRCQAPLEL
jgi:glycosyltransferase involved in cell wall biosynthesis